MLIAPKISNRVHAQLPKLPFIDSKKGTMPRKRTVPILSQSVNLSQNRTQPLPRPMTPDEVLSGYSKYLDAVDREEIRQYETIYFVRQLPISPNAKTARHVDVFPFAVSTHIAFRYEQIEIMGKGTYGIVIKCYDHKEHKFVSLKILHASTNNTKQLQMETEILQLMTQSEQDPEGKKHVITLMDKFTYRGYTVFITEILSIDLLTYLRGFNLQGMNPIKAKSIAFQIAKGLQFIHKNGVVHSDMKPENILFTDKNRDFIKIIDFGCSCYDQKPLYKVVESLLYRAPEVLFGFKYGKAIDIWAFACILIEMFTGKPLFHPKNDKDLIKLWADLLGSPPVDMVKCSPIMKKFFSEKPINRKAANQKKREIIDSRLGGRDQDLTDLISRCLEWLPSKRLNIDEIVNHPFFADVKDNKLPL